MGQDKPSELSEEEKEELPLTPGELFLWNWSSMIFDTFVQEVGIEKALSAVKPFYIHAGMAMAQNALKSTGKQKNDLEALVVSCQFIYESIHRDNFLPMLIKETCAIGETIACAMRHCRPEICIAYSHFPTQGMCEAINPNYEILWTQHQTDGAPTCKFVIKRKEANIKDLEREDMKERTQRLKLDGQVKEWVRFDVPGEGGIGLTRVFVDTCGSERTSELLRGRAMEWGEKVGTARLSELREKSIGELAAIVDSYEQSIKQYGKLVNKPNSAEKEIEECPLLSGPAEHCQQLEAFFNGICEAIDPNYEFVYDRMMTRGDKTCHWVIGKKGELLKEKPNGKTPSSGNNERKKALKALALKYAQGEITKDEYDELKELIQE